MDKEHIIIIFIIIIIIFTHMVKNYNRMEDEIIGPDFCLVNFMY